MPHNGGDAARPRHGKARSAGRFSSIIAHWAASPANGANHLRRSRYSVREEGHPRAEKAWGSGSTAGRLASRVVASEAPGTVADAPAPAMARRAAPKAGPSVELRVWTSCP